MQNNKHVSFQENNESTINVEEVTSTSLNPFFQTITEDLEQCKKMFEESSATDDAVSILEKYGANITSLQDMLSSEDMEIQYVIEKLKPRGEISMIYGGSGAGKSMVERCFLFAVAYGMSEYLGFKIDLPVEERKVCLIITEDTERSMRTLLKRQAQYFEQFRTIESPVLDVISSVEDETVKVLEKRLQEVNYSLIVIDTPQDEMVGSINDSTIIRQYFKGIALLAEKYNIAITVVHHKRKYTGDKEPSKEDLSGSQALNARPRVIYEFRENVNNPNYRNLTPVKANYESYEFLNTSYVYEMNPETLTFSDTGLRVPSDQVGMDTHKLDINARIMDKIKEYKHTNPKILQKEVLELLNEEFPEERINQSKVSRLMKKIQNNE